jgi:2,3-dihydroxyphenylpropionate 1,2-dioxygenase
MNAFPRFRSEITGKPLPNAFGSGLLCSGWLPSSVKTETTKFHGNRQANPPEVSMSLVYAGTCCHAPGITARGEMADRSTYERLLDAFARQRAALADSGVEALIMVSAEHFANFFMDNMPTFSIGMADDYEGPVEDPDWLKIQRTKVPGNPELSLRIITAVMQSVDVCFAQEWKLDHGLSVPLHFLTPEYELPINPGQHQLPGTAAGASAPHLGVWQGAQACR